MPNFYPYNPKLGQRIQTDAKGTSIDRAFGAHYHIDAEDAPAASSDGVHAAMALGAAEQSITTGITNPAVPRNIRIDGNVSGIDGVVKITGTNFAGEAITEDITANGTTAKDGNLAFKTVTKIDLPIQDHVPRAQVETATAAGTVTTAGNAAVTVKSALFAEDEVVDVPVELNDDAAAIALAIRTALAANEIIAEHFDVSGEDAAVVLTAKVADANDDTLNIAIDDGTGEGASEGVTTAATSANTTGGVGVGSDQISVGWGDKFGIPYKLYADELVILKLFGKAVEATEGVVTADAEDLEKNVYDPNAGADGTKDIDLYIIV
ncbi:MAG: hypothetical protein GX808_03990 [Syntrophomonadaceae bacterium]|jgi:hypothetical protein|nr:hypothetical protein [Syntrophomonadaceae bacterium]